MSESENSTPAQISAQGEAAISSSDRQETEIREGDFGGAEPGRSSLGAVSSEFAGASRGRDIPASTLVRLLGLPTKSELDVIETKLDTLNARITSLTAKIERLSTQVPQLFSDFDRTNVQIADLREFVRKALGAIVSQIESGSKPNREQLGQGSATKVEEKQVNILSSES